MLYHTREHGSQLLHGGELVPVGRGDVHDLGTSEGADLERVNRLWGYLPLRELGRSHLLPRGVHMAHHEVFGDLLHVLIVEEGVETQLVCKGTPLSG